MKARDQGEHDLGDVLRVRVGVDRAVGLGAAGDIDEVAAEQAVLLPTSSSLLFKP
jgi:hypothetical protein